MDGGNKRWVFETKEHGKNISTKTQSVFGTEESSVHTEKLRRPDMNVYLVLYLTTLLVAQTN
jgi:hypothetical protein